MNTSDHRDGKHLLAQLQEATQSHQLPRTALAPSVESQQTTDHTQTGDRIALNSFYCSVLCYAAGSVNTVGLSVVGEEMDFSTYTDLSIPTINGSLICPSVLWHCCLGGKKCV